MGQANRAPKSHYGRKFQISAHAIERFRERVDEEFISRPDGDLANLLDERITNAKKSENVVDHNYKSTTSTIYVIENRNGAQSLAVVRENTCVTVLDRDMLDVNVAKGAWSRTLNTPFATALTGVVPSVPRPKPAPVEAPVAPLPIVAPVASPPADPVRDAGMAYAAAKLEHARNVRRVAELEAEIARMRDVVSASGYRVEETEKAVTRAVEKVEKSLEGAA